MARSVSGVPDDAPVVFFPFDPVDAYGSFVGVLVSAAHYALECSTMGQGSEETIVRHLLAELGAIDHDANVNETGASKPLTKSQVAVGTTGREA